MPVKLQIGPQVVSDCRRLLVVTVEAPSGEPSFRLTLNPRSEDDYGNFRTIMDFVDKYRASGDPTGLEFAKSCYEESVLDPILNRLAISKLLGRVK